MGIAEVIPGVSGGTIAFITGIYEKLLNTIKAFGPDLIPVFQKEGIAGVWRTINGDFIVNLMIGMAIGVVIGVFGVTHLLEHYPVLLWAFFFGLIIASAIYVGKQVASWGVREIVALVAGTLIAYGISIAVPAEGNPALWFVFISGAIAISALILPGISGSFILLLMGMYTFIIPTLKNALRTLELQSLLILGVFGMGCLLGLMTFSRFLSWTFKHYRNPTLAALTGFMLGSLNKIWPWRVPISWLTDPETGEYVLNEEGIRKVITEQNVMPGSYTELTGEAAFFFLATIIACIGFVSVFLLEKLGANEK